VHYNAMTKQEAFGDYKNVDFQPKRLNRSHNFWQQEASWLEKHDYLYPVAPARGTPEQRREFRSFFSALNASIEERWKTEPATTAASEAGLTRLNVSTRAPLAFEAAGIALGIDTQSGAMDALSVGGREMGQGGGVPFLQFEYRTHKNDGDILRRASNRHPELLADMGIAWPLTPRCRWLHRWVKQWTGEECSTADPENSSAADTSWGCK
jgi:hypothetical protein